MTHVRGSKCDVPSSFQAIRQFFGSAGSFRIYKKIIRNLAGGFKYYLFSPLFGEGFQFD